ncbi:MAG: DUF5076 domain-containing protein [Pseudomonadota bacterium]
MKPFPNEIDLTAQPGLPQLRDEDTHEVLRAWVTHGGGSTVLFNPYALTDPSVFGILMADILAHAARAYALADETGTMTEADARAAILDMLNREAAAGPRDMKTINFGGPAN